MLYECHLNLVVIDMQLSIIIKHLVETLILMCYQIFVALFSILLCVC